jgi:hypothetical protein
VRLWILQEFVLAQDKILLCGQKAVSWVTICRVFTWTRLVMMQNDPSTTPHLIPEAEWHSLILCGRLTHPFSLIADFKSLQATRFIGAPRLHDQLSQLPDETISEQYQQRLRGVELLSHVFRYQATDPKDYIYGMTGVTGYQVLPDYSRKTTVAEVYQRFTETYLIRAKKTHKEGSLEADSDILWFFGMAGMGFGWRNTPGLPTWAPNFTGASEAFSRQRKDAFAFFDHNFGHNIKTLWDCDMPHTEGPTLCCMTTLIDEVRHVGPALYTCRAFQGEHDEPHEWLLQLFDCVVASRSDDRGPIGYGLFFEISKLFCERSRSSQQESVRVLEMMVADLGYVCETRRHLRRAEFTAQLCKELSTNQTHDLLRRSDWSHAQAIAERSVLARVADAILYSLVLSKVNKLCLTFTTSGCVGLLPTFAQVGDLVGVIKGYSLPVILRKSGDGYVLVGPCHMTAGYMQGEAIEMLQDGRAKMEEIKIY